MKHFIQKYKKAIIIPTIAFASLLLYFWNNPLNSTQSNFEPLTLAVQSEQPMDETNEPTNEIPKKDVETNKLLVDVKGAVKHPGVYSLLSTDRILDAIQAAGGYTEDANPLAINLAQKLSDEMVIYVPRKDEEFDVNLIGQNATTLTNSTSSNASNSGKINLNTASENDLQQLPGIGPSKAKAIIEYREEIGRFQSIEQLKNVSGIGDKTFEKLKEYIEI